MFKSGEHAVVRGSNPRRIVIVLPGISAPSSHRWPVTTSDGVFDESELSPAHPSVLATAEGRDLSAEASRADLLSRATHDRDAGVPAKLRKNLGDALAKATLDLNGHWKNGVALREDALSRARRILRGSMRHEDAEALLRSAQASTALDRWIPVDLGLDLTLRKCFFCGEEDFAMETNGQVVRIAGDPCAFPNGLPTTEWELNVPSGKLVIANDLRQLFPLPEAEDFDINIPLGCRQTTLAYAANGMAHAFVGNSCPGVFRCKDGAFKIANPPNDEVWDEEKEDLVKVTPVPAFDGEEIAGICTDLWWYSICDHAEFERRCARFQREAADFRVTIVDVAPGVYRFSHDEETHRRDGEEERVYARFTWVREPDPVQDFLARYENVEVNPNAYVQAQVARWPTLYGKIEDRFADREKAIPWSDMTEEDRLRSWQRVADHVFCTIGGGVEWHEKGFPKAKVDRAIPDVDPPSFRSQHHWYPFSKSYGGLFEPRAMTPSFAKFAFRVLESIISFGMHVRDDARSRDVRGVRERMGVAVQRYRELAERYPEHADPEYMTWLSQEGRAEAWVRSFELGPEFTDKHRQHAQRQRWVPENAYAVAFDATNLKDGHFAWHPQEPGVGGRWASKANAQRYAIIAWSDNGQPPEHNCFWSSHATNTSVPLYFVARVVKVGEVSHMGETLVEIAFDYGTPWMRDAGARKALSEVREKEGITVLSRDEYENLLQKAIEFFERAEGKIASKSHP